MAIAPMILVITLTNSQYVSNKQTSKFAGFLLVNIRHKIENLVKATMSAIG
ncbi:MAG: hypothetical protein ACJAW2_000311 [Shewanella sp.]|jgi:hypothetical protein